MNKIAPFVATVVTALMAASLLAGCAVGPNYHRPDIQTPAAFRELTENTPVPPQTASYADLPWWQVFQDPQLQELIRSALKQNYDLQIATERINAARAQLAITRSSLFPQVQADGNFSGGKQQFYPAKSNLLFLAADAAVPARFIRKIAQGDGSRARTIASY